MKSVDVQPRFNDESFIHRKDDQANSYFAANVKFW